MLIKTTVKKSSGRFLKYSLWWQPTVDPLSMEADMIRHGGEWITKKGEKAGFGLFYHYRRFQEIAWPTKLWEVGPFKNHWAEACLENYLKWQYVGVMGCAASGKSDSFGSNVLTDWYCHSDCTTVLVTSTDLKSLEVRIWGMVKKYHREAKANHSWLPGCLIEGKQMLILDPRQQASEGRDFKNGVMAVACKKGNQFVGLGSFVGIHSKRVRLLADECNLMPRAFLDSASNLSKCEDFKLVGLGNPNETTNAHGALCEPAPELGGWEGGIDQTPGTKTWKTRMPQGICLQLPGSDSPNLKSPDDQPVPFPFLITKKQMSDDAQIWGIDDWHYQMMTDAKMPRGQGSRRVLTRQMCLKFGAFEPALWRDGRRTRIGFLDAAYRGVGGDRCVFGELQFGEEASNLSPVGDVITNLIAQETGYKKSKQIIQLVDLSVIPIMAGVDADLPEYQIVRYVKEQCQNRDISPENFYFDSGMRTSLVSAFAKEWSPYVCSVDSGAKPSEMPVSAEIKTLSKDYYSKFITEMWFSVRMAVESRQFRGMRDDVVTEFSQREWKMVSGNRIEVETKDEMKLKTGRSPDLADAVAVGVFGARQKGFVIARLVAPPETRRNGRDWRQEAREKANKLNRSADLQYSS